ncbi:hypothetical protein BH10BAC5_BH10BAC5_00070 [soil metagenome]
MKTIEELNEAIAKIKIEKDINVKKLNYEKVAMLRDSERKLERELKELQEKVSK